MQWGDLEVSPRENVLYDKELVAQSDGPEDAGSSPRASVPSLDSYEEWMESKRHDPRDPAELFTLPYGSICNWYEPKGGHGDGSPAAVATIVVMVADSGAESRAVGVPKEDLGERLAFDGSRLVIVNVRDLETCELTSAELPRVFAQFTASPSSRPGEPSAGEPDRFEWLSAEGIGGVSERGLPIGRGAVPHLVGRRGRTVASIEAKLGIIIGIMDTPQEGAQVTVWGPEERLDVAVEVISRVVRGARSGLDRIRIPP